jgi:nucleoside-triphosphatase
MPGCGWGERVSVSKNILITGAPGCGKTTLLRQLVRQLQGRHPVGFYTAEIRKGRVRQGFRLTGLNGCDGLLAHVALRTGYRLGKYGVDVAGFEKFLERVDFFNPEAGLIMIDEIGKMECFSGKFCRLVETVLDGETNVIATVAETGGGPVAQVKQRRDVRLLKLSPANRDELLVRLGQTLGESALL